MLMIKRWFVCCCELFNINFEIIYLLHPSFFIIYKETTVYFSSSVRLFVTFHMF